MLFALVLALALQTIGHEAARDHVGQQATVCGIVEDARYAHASNRQRRRS